MTCNLCPLTTDRQVPGYGGPQSKLVVIGDYPTSEDKTTGIPFSGGANPRIDYPNFILHRALAAIGLDVDQDVFLAYALRCNPWRGKEQIKIKPQFRTTCKTRHLDEELKPVAADLVLVMGDEAFKAILPEMGGSSHHVRGRWHEVVLGGRRRLARVTYSCGFIQKMSLFTAKELSNGKIVSDERWNPPGSCGWLFTQDILAVKKKLAELEDAHAT